ncbi:unnamed protein product [Parajaminaea phylloscopi]
MSATIDLTSEESPPRPPALTLPRGNNATSEASSSGSGRNTRQTPRERARQRQHRQQAADPQPTRRPIDLSASEEGFEFTGMSEGARLASERARRQAEEAQRWRQDFLAIQRAVGEASSTLRRANDPSTSGASRGAGSSTRRPTNAPSTSGTSQGGGAPSNGVRIHDVLAPGPHAHVNRASGPIVAATDAIRSTVGNLPGLEAVTRILQATPNFVWGGAGNHNQQAGPQRGGGPVARGGRGGGASHGGVAGRFRKEMEKIIPPKHDPRFVLNHNKRQSDGSLKSQSLRKGFSFGIIEPPLDVEAFEQDPRIIRGPLPDTSAICAGCDCALVLDGHGQRRMWALPCGHVIDGRCYARYCHGVSVTEARQMAHCEVLAAQRRPKKSSERAAASPEAKLDTSPHLSATKTKVEAGASTSASQDALSRKRYVTDSDTEEEEESTGPDSMQDRRQGQVKSGSEAKESHSSALLQRLDSQDTRPNKRMRLRARPSKATGGTSSDASKSQTSESMLPDDAGSPKAASRLVKTFTCPVEGCGQRCTTTTGKTTSAIELYV